MDYIARQSHGILQARILELVAISKLFFDGFWTLSELHLVLNVKIIIIVGK